jgi:hypothetical protein
LLGRANPNLKKILAKEFPGLESTGL